jgi:hypothetical protein
MKTRLITALAAGLTLGLFLPIAPAEETESPQSPPVGEIVDRANRAAYYQGKDDRAQVRMEATDS